MGEGWDAALPVEVLGSVGFVVGQEHSADKKGGIIVVLRAYRVRGAADFCGSLLGDGGPSHPGQPAAVMIND